MSGEKIGVSSLFMIKYSGHRHYVVLDPKIVDSYDLKIGDLLKIEIIEVRRKPKEAN